MYIIIDHYKDPILVQSYLWWGLHVFTCANVHLFFFDLGSHGGRPLTLSGGADVKTALQLHGHQLKRLARHRPSLTIASLCAGLDVVQALNCETFVGCS